MTEIGTREKILLRNFAAELVKAPAISAAPGYPGCGCPVFVKAQDSIHA
jgi:hypothetical protein